MQAKCSKCKEKWASPANATFHLARPAQHRDSTWVSVKGFHPGHPSEPAESFENADAALLLPVVEAQPTGERKVSNQAPGQREPWTGSCALSRSPCGPWLVLGEQWELCSSAHCFAAVPAGDGRAGVRVSCRRSSQPSPTAGIQVTLECQCPNTPAGHT